MQMKDKHSINKIKLPQMTNAINRSGYLMEHRIFPVIEKEGFYVETNPVYLEESFVSCGRN